MIIRVCQPFESFAIRPQFETLPLIYNIQVLRQSIAPETALKSTLTRYMVLTLDGKKIIVDKTLQEELPWRAACCVTILSTFCYRERALSLFILKLHLNINKNRGR